MANETINHQCYLATKLIHFRLQESWCEEADCNRPPSLTLPDLHNLPNPEPATFWTAETKLLVVLVMAIVVLLLTIVVAHWSKRVFPPKNTKFVGPTPRASQMSNTIKLGDCRTIKETSHG